MNIEPGVLFTDEKFVVHQTHPEQHWHGIELRQLLAQVSDRINPIWEAENNGPAVLVGLYYDFDQLGLSMDSQRHWYSHKPWANLGLERLNYAMYAFAFSREQILQGLLQSSHLCRVVSDQLRFGPSPNEDELLTALRRSSISEVVAWIQAA